MLRLTEKYFSHSRSYRYRDWNKELMDILDITIIDQLSKMARKCFFLA